MADRQFNLLRADHIQRLNEILFFERSESDFENVNEIGDESDTEGEDHVGERGEGSETEQSGEEAIVDDSRPNEQQLSSPQQVQPQQVDGTQQQQERGNQQVQPQQVDGTQQQQERGNDNLFVTAKNGNTDLKWYLLPRPQNQRTLPQNIIRRLPGVIGSAKQSKTPLECWSNFFTDAMLEKIVRFTNLYIESVQQRFARIRDAKLTDVQEIKACIGILYLLGVNRSNRQSLEEVWATDGTGIEKCRLTMSLRRFKFLLRCLRFDDLATRPLRRQTDNLAAIRELFEHFVSNCKKAYSLGENVTVDEKLEAFRGRCHFRQYIPSKPAKYGIKIFALCDAKTFYTSNLEIYCGKQPQGPRKTSNKAEEVVKRLSEHIYGSGRNITADNWFTSIDLVDFLKSKKLSYVGTLKKNRIGIPSELKNIKQRPVDSSFFLFSENSTMVSYVPKKNKNVLLISSLHHDDEIIASNKPEIINYYNKTKSGVDCVDKLCSTYNVARNTRRWPMVVFFAMCNVAGINAVVVSYGNGVEVNNRRSFLRKLSEQLIVDHIQRRSETTVRGGMSCALQKSLKRFKPNPEEEREANAGPANHLDKRVKCRPCSEEKRSRVTRYICYQCKRAICLEHAEKVCMECAPQLQLNPIDDADSSD